MNSAPAGPRTAQGRLVLLVAASVLALAGTLAATTVVPISDREIFRRADVVVHGIVAASDTVEAADGWPETVTFVRPLRVWKGSLSGDLVLRQAGGTLSDGRFFKLWGRPEYKAGDEVIVFAIALPEGGFQTAEMLLGKFTVARDESGRFFAVPDLAIGDHPGVTVRRMPGGPDRIDPAEGEGTLALVRPERLPPPALSDAAGAEGDDAPRELTGFLDFLDTGAVAVRASAPAPVGDLSPVVHAEPRKGLVPHWGNINNSLWRYNDGATEGWALDGTANMTGGGIAEATGALATWTNDPTSNINFTVSLSGASPIHMSATSSSCGWSTCLGSSGGVIGCGGPRGGGGNSWRGDSYTTITSGEVWLRCYATANAFGSVTTQSVLTHELGHTLGLGHSDQNVSVHDTCRGDESQAMMRSYAQNRTTLGADDRDAIRWLYGDGLTSCADLPAPTVSGFSPPTGTPSGNTTFTLTGANFQTGLTVRIGGALATVTNVTSTSVAGRTPAHAFGTADVLVTNPDAKSATLSGGYFYDFADVPAAHMFHNAVVKIFKNGITTGCGGNNFCPDQPVSRDQMAVFVLRGAHGGGYMPPAASGQVFADVAANTMFAKWMEQFYAEGIIDACDPSPLAYCPSTAVSRADMAVLLLRAKHGSDYEPPNPTGVFPDVPGAHPLAAWIERLYAEGITSGCGSGLYCPDRPNTRGEMAVFLMRTFNLP
jgi:hypothetical protein